MQSGFSAFFFSKRPDLVVIRYQ